MTARLPERGTPAYTATADQFDAAQRDATGRAAALLHAGALLVAPDGPWAARMFDSVRPGAPARVVCHHISAMNGPTSMYVTAPGTLVCPACLAREADRHRDICAGCRKARSGPLPHRIHIAQRGIAIAHGRLCFTCSTIEHRPKGPR